MAAPTLQAEGATATGVTTGVPSITIPTHQADDILLVCSIFWGPNTANDAAQIPTPSGWTLLGTQTGQPAAADRDGWLACFWRRATGAGHTVTMARGASWDTGNDTCFNGRAYVIRGCRTVGDPWDDETSSGPHTAANQAFPAVTVSGAERTVIIFGLSTDNAAFAMTSSGWTDGTEDDDTGGTDSAFQTVRKSNVSASTSADTSTVAAPTQGAYAFMGVSFKPPTEIAVGSSDGTSTVDAAGVAAANSVGDNAAGVGAATATGAALAAAVGASDGVAAATATGQAAFDSAGSAAGTGDALATGASLGAGAGASDGVGAATAAGQSSAASVASSDGVGAVSAVGQSTAAAVGDSAGIGAATGIGAALAPAVASSDGVGAAAGTGAALSSAVGSAAGVAEALGVGDTAAQGSVGASQGTASVTATGASIVAAVGAGAGSSDASAVGTSQGGQPQQQQQPQPSNGGGTYWSHRPPTFWPRAPEFVGWVVQAVGHAAGTSTALAVGQSLVSSKGVAKVTRRRIRMRGYGDPCSEREFLALTVALRAAR